MVKTDTAVLLALGAAFFIAIGDVIDQLWALRTPELYAWPLVAIACTAWQDTAN
jgi:hypothetical protein